MPASIMKKANVKIGCAMEKMESQNDIRKIIETYHDRKEEDRYSKRVSMEEIEKNDFNLNLSRYGSTTQSEREIDLKDVNERLVAIEKKAKEAADKHSKFLKELGLPPI